MPRSGGEADKLGNHFEAVWTVNAVLDLFEGRYQSICVEALGDESAYWPNVWRNWRSVTRRFYVCGWTPWSHAPHQDNLAGRWICLHHQQLCLRE